MPMRTLNRPYLLRLLARSSSTRRAPPPPPVVPLLAPPFSPVALARPRIAKLLPGTGLSSCCLLLRSPPPRSPPPPLRCPSPLRPSPRPSPPPRRSRPSRPSRLSRLSRPCSGRYLSSLPPPPPPPPPPPFRRLSFRGWFRSRLSRLLSCDCGDETVAALGGASTLPKRVLYDSSSVRKPSITVRLCCRSESRDAMTCFESRNRQLETGSTTHPPMS